MSSQRIGIGVLAALMVFAGSVAAEPLGQQAEPGVWLDQPLVGWNSPGMDIPVAPSARQNRRPACAAAARDADTPADQALIDAGWHLVGAYEAGWGILFIGATDSYDSLCQPIGYQGFVFVDGAFAGTLSPALMDTAADASATQAAVSQNKLVAHFTRYGQQDPACCPTRAAVNVEYDVQRTTPAAPVLVPIRAVEAPAIQQTATN